MLPYPSPKKTNKAGVTIHFNACPALAGEFPRMKK
jgi:hypothetical protein